MVKSKKISTFNGEKFWNNAFAHERGNLLKKMQVPEDQIKILANKKYYDLPAPLRYEIETKN